MNTPIATLLERAAVALPPQRPSRSSWSPFAPVVRQLMTNGHTVLSSVDWLIEQREVKQADRTKAYRSLLAPPLNAINKYRLPGDPLSADDLPWWHELIRAVIFVAALAVLTYGLMGLTR